MLATLGEADTKTTIDGTYVILYKMILTITIIDYKKYKKSNVQCSVKGKLQKQINCLFPSFDKFYFAVSALGIVWFQYH